MASETSVSSVPSSNPYEIFFGENPEVSVRAEDRFGHDTFNLPEAYRGKNLHLEKQIWWMLNDQAEFFVRDICPWEETDQITVQWNIWKFNHTLADLEPEQGVPRYITQEHESRTDSLVRRGLAFMIEHGFYKTKEGQEHYLANLQQIVDAVHTTVYYGVLQALLNGKNHYKEWNRKYGHRGTQIDDIFRDERRRWAIAQKVKNGFYILDAELKDQMKRNNVTPNVWVFPPKMKIFLTMVPSNEVVYSEKGPGKDANLEKGPDNMLTFRGSKVYEAAPLDVDFMGEPNDMLSREKMIGSYFTMYDTIPDMKPKTYKSDMRSIYIFDMGADKFRKITLRQAVKYCMYFDMNSNDAVAGADPNGHMVKENGKPFATFQDLYDKYKDDQEFLVHWNRFVKDCTTEIGAKSHNDAAAATATTDIKGAKPKAKQARPRFNTSGAVFSASPGDLKFTEGVFMDLIQNNIRLPVAFLLCRPFQRYTCASAICAAGGKDLGVTYHGHHDFQLDDDIIHKTHTGHYTFYSKTVIRDEKRYTIAEDVFCTGYKGGEDCRFFQGAEDWKNQVRMGRFKASIMSLMVPPHRVNDAGVDLVKNPLDFRGTFDDDALATISADAPDMDVETYPGGHVYRNGLSMDNVEWGQYDQDVFHQEFEMLNRVCFAGRQMTYNWKQGDFSHESQETGHWGPKGVYEGCRDAREGKNTFLERPQKESTLL